MADRDSKPPADTAEFVKWCKEHGIEEVLITAKRRDRLGSILGATALTLVVALGGWWYNEGIDRARSDEQLRARITYLESANNERRGISVAIARIESSVEALGVQVDVRFRGLEERLARSERLQEDREPNHRRDR